MKPLSNRHLRLLQLLMLLWIPACVAFILMCEFPLYVYSIADVLLYRPFDAGILVSLCWLFCTGPSTLLRRCCFYIALAVACWLRSKDAVQFPTVYLACVSMALFHGLAAEMISLGGWDRRWKFRARSQCNIKFSLTSILLVTIVIASLSLAAQGIFTRDDFFGYWIICVGMSATAACIQHSLTTDQLRKTWAVRAGMVALVTTMVISTWRWWTVDPRNLQSFFGNGGLLYCRLWLDVVASLTFYALFVATFPACVAYDRLVRTTEMQVRSARVLEE